MEVHLRTVRMRFRYATLLLLFLTDTLYARKRVQLILVECLALWGERERSRRQYRSQVSVFKPALFTEHSNTDKMKKRRTVADFVANIGESGDRDRCLGTSVAYLDVNTRP